MSVKLLYTMIFRCLYIRYLTQSLVLCAVFCSPLFVFLIFFFWPLYCLWSFDLSLRMDHPFGNFKLFKYHLGIERGIYIAWLQTYTISLCVCVFVKIFVKIFAYVVIRMVVWIYNYLCNQCPSPLTLWVRISLMARCTLYNIIW